jgi:hypothetical protein
MLIRIVASHGLDPVRCRGDDSSLVGQGHLCSTPYSVEQADPLIRGHGAA